MTLNQILKATKQIRNGANAHIQMQTIKGDYSKITECPIRKGIKWGNMKGVESKGQTQSYKQYVSECIFQNTNNGEYYIQLFVSSNPNSKSKSKYFYKGQPITKEQYDQANPSRPQTQPLKTFTKNIKDIILIA